MTNPNHSAAKTAILSPLSRETGPRKRTTGFKSEFLFCFSLIDHRKLRSRERRDTREKETPALPQARVHNGRVFFPQSLKYSFFLSCPTLRLSFFCSFSTSKPKPKRPRKDKKTHEKNSLKIAPNEKTPKQFPKPKQKGSSPSTERATGLPSPPCSPGEWASSAASAGTTS